MVSQSTIYFVTAVMMCTLGFVSMESGLKCYECNVWKAGYGHKCDNPRIRDDCLVCMKVHTVVNIGYYKNTPRESEVVSRICAKSSTVHFSNECYKYQSSDGTSERCYCDSDLCNTSSNIGSALKLITLCLFLSVGLIVDFL